MARNHHLGDTLTILYDEILLREVDEHHAHLTAIVGVHRSRGIQHGDAFLQGQSTTWAHLCLVTLGQGNMQSCRDESALQWFQRDGLVYIRSEVHASTEFRGILWQWLVTLVYNFYLQHALKFHFNSVCKGTIFFRHKNIRTYFFWFLLLFCPKYRTFAP